MTATTLACACLLLFSLSLGACITAAPKPAMVHAGPATRSALPALALPALAGGCAGASRELDRLRIDGRTQRSAGGGARFAWSGTAFTFHFRSTELQVELEDSGRNYFEVELDGVVLPAKLAAFSGAYCYTLARDLPAGEHRLTLTRITEAFLGESELRSIALGPSGEWLLPEPAPERRLEVIGDSITAAYGVLGADRACHFSAATENQRLSYAALLASALRAQLSSVAWSGKGVFSNRGSQQDTIPMPPLWERTLPERADSRWPFASWQPGAVVIALGTNDFAAENPDKTPFAAAYLAFVNRVREVYPRAALFCALSPLLSDAWPPGARSRSLAKVDLEHAVAFRNTHGDARVFFVEHAATPESEGYGCDWHPSRRTHERMAGELREAFAKNLGW